MDSRAGPPEENLSIKITSQDRSKMDRSWVKTLRKGQRERKREEYREGKERWIQNQADQNHEDVGDETVI